MTEPTAVMPDASITPAMIDRMKEKVGVNLRIGHSVNNEEATRIAVVKFAGGIGDINPLWTDRDYASSTVYGRPVAPPSFIIGCFSGMQFGWPGLGAFHNATQMDLLRPIFWGDTVTATCRYDGFDGPKSSSFAEQMVTDHFTNEYTNQDGVKVAEMRWQVMHYERTRARSSSSRKRTAPVVPHRWSPEEIDVIEAQVLRERPRGAQQLWWEDVEVGDPVDSLTKGPIGLTDEVAFIAGGGTPIPRLKAHAASLQEYRAQPAWTFRDPVTSASEPIYAVHYNTSAARAMGVTYAYDVGFQRQCWQVQLLTHWVGDDGWVRHAAGEYRGFVYLSDVVTLGGEVLEKSIDENGEHLVKVRTFALNQRGDDVMPGTATVALPSRATQHNPVSVRLP